ncbi:MAG: sulfotransferase family 2 domain-containing protein [Anaerolineae bacterium]|nr:sulfotransferase family 2 domain-containing protein [Anaerolineae bacterium]
MIISDEHRYLFVELPRTGSTAISKELREHYAGKPILFKHATYSDFAAIATDDQKNYFVFSGIRNPLDDAVSLFYKLRTNHREQYSRMQNNKRFFSRLVMYPTLKKFQYIQDHDPDFSDYFLKFYRYPFSNWSTASHKKFNTVIRFEHIQEDFAQVLKLMGVEQKRPLPVINKTGKKRDPFAHYSPAARERAKKVFGPFMNRWGYDFPADWGETTIPWGNQLQFDLLNFFRKIYWEYIRAYVHARLHPERPNKWQPNI